MCWALALRRFSTIILLFPIVTESVILPGQCPKIHLSPDPNMLRGRYQVRVKVPFDVTDSYFFDNRTREACIFEIEINFIFFHENGKKCPIAIGEKKQLSNPGSYSAEIFLSHPVTGHAITPKITEYFMFYKYTELTSMMWSCRNLDDGKHDEAFVIIQSVDDETLLVVDELLAYLDGYFPNNSIRSEIAHKRFDTTIGACSSDPNQTTCKIPIRVPYQTKWIFYLGFIGIIITGIFVTFYWPSCKRNNQTAPMT